MRPILLALVTAAACICAISASAFTIVPAGEESGKFIVVVERDFGDVVPLSALPKPYDSIIQQSQGPDTLSFRWRYFRSDEEGTAFIHVDGDGSGVAHFAFDDRSADDGNTIGAVIVMLDAQGRAMRGLGARAVLSQRSQERRTIRYEAELSLRQPLEWWRQVRSLAFLTMKYYIQQSPDEEGIVDAMKRAASRFTDGRDIVEIAKALPGAAIQ